MSPENYYSQTRIPVNYYLAGQRANMSLNDILGHNLPENFTRGIPFDVFRNEAQCPGNRGNCHNAILVRIWHCVVFGLVNETRRLNKELFELQTQNSQLIKSLQDSLQKTAAQMTKVQDQAAKDIAELKQMLQCSEINATTLRAEKQQLKSENDQLKNEVEQLKNQLTIQKENHSTDLLQVSNQNAAVLGMFKILEAKLNLIGAANSASNSTASSLEDS